MPDEVLDVQEIILAAKRRGVFLENPLLADLPDWVSGFRPQQKAAIEQIMEKLETVDLVFVDGPTGTGKTLIGEAVRRLYQGEGVYICHGKTLQDQFLRDFSYAKVLKGKSNYTPDRIPRNMVSDNVSCDDCDGNYCSVCPYRVAKAQAMAADLAVLNTSYFLAECNGPGLFSGRDLVIADEADTLEGVLMSHVEINISPFRMKKYGWKPPKKVTVKEAWEDWLQEVLELANEEFQRLPEYEPDLDLKLKREIKWLSNFMDKCQLLRNGLETDTWVFDGKKDELEVKFKPVTVDLLGKQMLWRHGQKWLCMSATLISSQEIAESLGWDKPYETVSIDSGFPIKNRPVKVLSVANMGSKANKDGDESKKLFEVIEDLCMAHPDEKVLIHTVSYQLARDIVGYLNGGNLSKEGVNRLVFTYQSGPSITGRDRIVEQWKKDRTPSIMVAPSLDRGVDLPGDLCRVQIIAKVPYPYLGDKKVSARLYSKGGKVWYAVQTVRTIVQMTGRAVRNDTDFAVTYILDSNFDSLWSKNKRLFPKWWRDGLQWQRMGG